MARAIGVQIGLLAFGAALLAGVAAGNSPVVVLVRALTAMVLGLVVGQVAGAAAHRVLREHLLRKKLAIDREHLDLLRTSSPGPPDPDPPAATEAEAR